MTDEDGTVTHVEVGKCYTAWDPYGRAATFKVERATNYGSPAEPDWYVEGRTFNGDPVYCKQKTDGLIFEENSIQW